MRFFAVLLACSYGVASAQEVERDEEGRDIRHLTRQEIQEGEFRDLQIDGQLVGPSLAQIASRPALNFTPFIRLRTEFTAEMKAGIDEVK